MINFIICSKNDSVSGKVKAIIKRFMMNFDIDDRVYFFNQYDNNFKNSCKDIKGFSVYIIDIDKERSFSLNTCKYIRHELNNWNSVIITLVDDKNLRRLLLESGLFLFDSLLKEENYEEKLTRDLFKMKKHYDNREKCLTFEFNHIIRKIDFKDIVIIKKEKDSKRCIIVSSYGNNVINKNLKRVMGLLDERFIKVSRSLIINTDQISYYDSSSNKVTFKNGMSTFEISKSYKNIIASSIKNYNK